MQRAEILAIGSELLLGGRPETNSLVLTEQLASLGIEVRVKSVVGDEESDIAAAIRITACRARVLVLTGGLGSTQDDCTRRAVARATGRPLRRHPKALEAMRQRLAVWGRTPTTAQLRQALIPSGADVLPNPIGSAPGFCLTWRGCFLAALPGVPAEAARMFAESVAPRLVSQVTPRRASRHAPLTGIERCLLHTFGLSEADLDARLRQLSRGARGVRLGLTASPLGVTLSFTASGPRATRAGRSGSSPIERLVAAARRVIGQYIYGEGADSMEAVVGRHLAASGIMLAVAESCTGGLIGHRLTQVPGSSAYLDRVLVCYSDRAKTELLGVPPSLIARHGAVSVEVAAAMARGVRLRSGAGIGLSVTGIAGPGGGTERKPVGLVHIGLDSPTGRQTHTFRFHGTREAIKLRASQAALDILRKWLAARAARTSMVEQA